MPFIQREITVKRDCTDFISSKYGSLGCTKSEICKWKKQEMIRCNGTYEYCSGYKVDTFKLAREQRAGRL